MTICRGLLTMSDCNRLSSISKQWKRRREGCAFAYAVTLGRNRSAVKLDEMSNDREAETQPAKAPRRGTICLTKTIENARQKIRLYSLPRVGHAHTCVSAIAVDAHKDLSAVRCEFHRV